MALNKRPNPWGKMTGVREKRFEGFPEVQWILDMEYHLMSGKITLLGDHTAVLEVLGEKNAGEDVAIPGKGLSSK